MEHSYYIDRLSAYSDRELTGEEQEIVRQHVESCVECRATLAEYQKLEQLVESNSELGQSDYWEDAARKIEAWLTSEEETKVTDVSRGRSRWLGWKMVSVAATFAVLTFVALNREDIVKKVLQAPASKPSMVERPADRAGTKSEIVSDSEKQLDIMTVDKVESKALSSDDDRLQAAGHSQDAPVKEPEKIEGARARLQPKPSPSAPAVVGLLRPSGGDVEAESMDAGTDRSASSKDQLSEAMKSNEGVEIAVARVARQPAAITEEGQTSEMIQFDELAQGIADSIALPSLEFWRARRDSLEDNLKVRGESPVREKRGVQSLSMSVEGSDPGRIRLKRDLLESYYHIGKQTEQRTEFEQSLKYIRQYLRQRELPSQSLAAKWLKELESMQLEKWEEER